MNRFALMAMALAAVSAMALVADAIAQDPPRGASTISAPTLPPTQPCPAVEVPRLRPDEGDIPIGSADASATSLPVPSFMAAPSMAPEPCPSPMPLAPGPRPLNHLHEGLRSLTPRIQPLSSPTT